MLKICHFFVFLSLILELSAQDVEIVTFTDSCINSDLESKLCFKITNYSEREICLYPECLEYYVDLFDSKGDYPKRIKRIEHEKSGPEVIFIKANESYTYCMSTHFFRQFELKCNETYYYYPTYYTSLRKKVKGIRPLRGPVSSKPLVFKICNCP
jgi:hypothetical protein